MTYDDQAEDSEEAIQARRKGVVVISLVSGIALMIVNVLMLRPSMSYFPMLAMLGPALIVIAGYYLILPEDPWELPKPIPFRLILMLILAFGLGAANWWASENGWYLL